MAPSALHNPTEASTSQESTGGTWHTLRQWPNQWRSNQLKGMAPKLLFLTGFLINSAALAGLFFLLGKDFAHVQSKNITGCIEHYQPYNLSIQIACAYFILLSAVLFVMMCVMQCKKQKLENSAYRFVSILGVITLLLSVLLVLISAMVALNPQKSCKWPFEIAELMQRYVFQSAASFITSLIYTIVGLSLVKRQAQSTVSPVPPTTPVYQIRPPEFDSLFPPPPTYQQSEMYHQQRMNR